jgi:CPA2 family monovalent cation:H+ antiporter-2
MLLEVIAILALAGLGLVVGRLVGLSPIPSYLLAGVLAGPGGLGWLVHTRSLDALAEIGVALLLFGVGIEFSLDRLRRRLGRMVTSGALQVGLTVLLAAVALRAGGAPFATAVFVGFLVSLSSTAIVFKLYADEGQIDAPQGQAAAGILFFQDLALVPMMLLVPVLASPGEAIAVGVAQALGGALVALGILLWAARTALPRAVAFMARLRVPELFPLVAFLVALGTALLASRVGLSVPIGAFLAGLALSGTRYGHQLFAEVQPLRDAFVAVFFTSIGMLFEPGLAADAWQLGAGMVGLIALKAVVVGGVVWLLWRSAALAVMVALALAQIGEFSFVLARAGAGAGLLSAAEEQAFLGAAILTMAVTPLAVGVGRRLADRTSHTIGETVAERDHVLVIGHGTTGQAVSRVLGNTGVRFVAVDFDVDVVAAARQEGLPIHFGDASKRAILEQLGAPRARAAVVALGDPAATRRAVATLRELNPHLRILARTAKVTEVPELEALGASEVIPSELEASIELFVRLLLHLGVPPHVVRVEESLLRVDHYAAMRTYGASPGLLDGVGQLIAAGILETAQVMAGSSACDRTIQELEVRRRTGATILAIVRDDVPLPSVTPATQLRAGDRVVLHGPHEAIDEALGLFEPETPRPDV